MSLIHFGYLFAELNLGTISQCMCRSVFRLGQHLLFLFFLPVDIKHKDRRPIELQLFVLGMNEQKFRRKGRNLCITKRKVKIYILFYSYIKALIIWILDYIRICIYFFCRNRNYNFVQS